MNNIFKIEKEPFMVVDTIEGPAFLAPALVNGEFSSMDEIDMQEYKSFVKTIPEGSYIVGIEGDQYSGYYNGKICMMFNYVTHRRIKRQ